MSRHARILKDMLKRCAGRGLVTNGLLLLFALICISGPGSGRLFAGRGDADAYNNTSDCRRQGSLVLSSSYSPYSVHLIRSETSGRIIRINCREGHILRAGTPLIEIDSHALRNQLQQLQAVLSSLRKSEKVLSLDLDLSRKKYQRYLALKKRGHIEEQAVENIEKEFHAAELSLIENRRQQADIRMNIIELKDRISKCAPSFSRDLYVAENFKELFETVVPGDKISRLLDVSMAKVHLVLSPRCFPLVKRALERERSFDFELVTEDGRAYFSQGRVEKLKIDRDNSYLYSYGLDLVFKPIPDILWGQVVKVRLDLRHKKNPGGRMNTPAAKSP